MQEDSHGFSFSIAADKCSRCLEIFFREFRGNQRVLVIHHGTDAGFPDLVKKNLIPSVLESEDSSEERRKN